MLCKFNITFIYNINIIIPENLYKEYLKKNNTGLWPYEHVFSYLKY